jgi:hypothetical protein
MVKAAQNGADFFHLSSIAAHGFLIIIASLWLAKVNSILPEPYLVSPPFLGVCDTH